MSFCHVVDCVNIHYFSSAFYGLSRPIFFGCRREYLPFGEPHDSFLERFGRVAVPDFDRLLHDDFAAVGISLTK